MFRNFLFFVIAFSQIIIAQPASKNVAVLDFQGLGLSPFEAIALSERFRIELFATQKYVVLERGKMDEILSEQGFQKSGCTTDECLVEIGKLINVQYIFGGTISKFGEVFTVMVRLIDVQTGKIVQSQAVDLPIAKEKLMTEGMRNVAAIFAGQEAVKIPQTYTPPPVPGEKKLFEPEMVFVKGGSFMMGDVFDEGENDEKPVHLVTLDDYYISKCEITFDQYSYFCNELGFNIPEDENWGTGSNPVINITIKDALAYCDWLSFKTKKKFTLPTEAQWEFAARERGAKIRYSGTSDKKEVYSYTWFEVNSKNKTHPVGKKKPNKLGLFDMNGNVAEFCLDTFGDYPDRPVKNYISTENNRWQIVRGGNFNSDEESIRNTNRWPVRISVKWEEIGFRIVQNTN